MSDTTTTKKVPTVPKVQEMIDESLCDILTIDSLMAFNWIDNVNLQKSDISGNLASNASILEITYGGGKFIGYIASFVSRSYIYSDDGQTFKSYDINFSDGSSVNDLIYSRGICYGNGKFVGIEPSGIYFVSSSDGITWTKSENIGDYSITGQSFRSICFGNGKFVAVGYNGTATSTDGINWTTNWIGGNFEVVCYGNGKYIACGYDTGIYYSTDGLNWTKTSDEQQIYNICYGNGIYFGIQQDSSTKLAAKGLLSYDGINWKTTSIPDVGIRQLYYSLGVFFFLTEDSRIVYYSYDCDTWNKFPGITNTRYERMCYGGGHLVFQSPYSVLTATIKTDIFTNFINLLHPVNTSISTTNSSLMASPEYKFPGTTWKLISSSNGIYTYERIE